MLFSIAWRNIWRNKTRSLIIMASIASGLLGGIVASAFTYGMADQMTRTSILTRISHIQIHSPKFVQNHDLDYPVHDYDSVKEFLQKNKGVRAYSPRVIVTAMAASPQTATGVEIRGVNVKNENRVSSVPQSLVEGSWFGKQSRNPVVIGKQLAEKLSVGINSKIVFNFQDSSGTITGAAFRIVGIFETVSSTFDETTVYVKKADLGKLLGTGESIYEIAVLLNSIRATDTVVSAMRKTFPDLRIQSWRQLSPDLDYMAETLDTMLYIFMGIIILALAFGIVNTMLMVILERVRELGMLMAVGMQRSRIFLMIMLETVFLSSTGAFFGMVLSFIVLKILTRTGIDLSLFSQGLREFGISEILYPSIRFSMYPVLTIMIIITAVLSSIYPAVRALRLRPSDALRMT